MPAARFSRLGPPLLPFSDEPQVRAGEHSFIVTHGTRKCEVGRAVVRDENAALSYAAALFEMQRKGRSDHAFCRRLEL